MPYKYPIRIHPLFSLMIVITVWTGQFLEIITLIVLVLIHEWGHVVAAESYGWKIEVLELLPFGGVVRMENGGSTTAAEEIVVALAGPFQHVFLILVSLLFYTWGWWGKEWTEFFIHSNLVIALFNLLPIYPLDGGRITQALFSLYLPFRRTLFITLIFSCCLASMMVVLAFCFPGITVHVSLLMVSLFLLSSNLVAWKQIPYQFVRFLLHKSEQQQPQRKIQMVTIKRGASTRWLLHSLFREKYHLFRMVDSEGKVVATIPEEEIIRSYLRESYPFDK